MIKASFAVVLGITVGVSNMLTPIGVFAQVPIEEYRQLESRLNIFERLLASEGLIRLHDELKGLGRELRELRGVIEVDTNGIKLLKNNQVKQYQDLDNQLRQLSNDLGQLKSGLEQLQDKVEALENARSEAALQLNIGVDMTPDVPDATPAAAGTGIASVSTERQVAATPVVSATAEASASMTEVKPAETAAVVDESPRSTVDIPAAPSSSKPLTPTTVTVSEPIETDVAQPVYDPLIEQQAYRSAFVLLKNGHYEKATIGFRDFLTEYPGSDLADNAQYWLGESFYAIPRFESAMEEFKRILSNYPQSPKLTHAMLKIGYIYHELGQLEDAKRVLSELSNRYPDSTAASLARRRLKRLADG